MKLCGPLKISMLGSLFEPVPYFIYSIIGFSFDFFEVKKATERDPNTTDWIDEDKKPKRKKMTVNQIVSKHPQETVGKTEPEIYKMFGSIYHII